MWRRFWCWVKTGHRIEARIFVGRDFVEGYTVAHRRCVLCKHNFGLKRYGGGSPTR